MRLTSLLSALALLVATLGFPAQQSCYARVPAQSGPTATAPGCCGSGPCQCRQRCSCLRAPQGEAEGIFFAVPVQTVTDSLLALVPQTMTGASADAGPALPVLIPVAICPRGLSAPCLGDRAPPLS